MESTRDNVDGQLGSIAVEKELLNPRQVKHAREEAARREAEGAADVALGDVLVELGYLTDEQLTAVRAEAQRRRCRIQGYRILEKVGQGSVGMVFRALQIAMERDVALKILNPDLARKPSVVEMYVKEARAVAKLNHPHIVQGIDVGESGGFYYFSMEFLGGGTFADLLSGGPMEGASALVYLYQVASALEHAWSRQIIHCDIKPANLMLDAEGRLKVTDLGLADVAETMRKASKDTRRVVRGTPHYISPEQIDTPGDLDCRSDIYSLGATFYHLLAGRTPFEGENKKAIMLARLREKPRPLAEHRAGLDPRFARLVDRMLETDRERRPQTPTELRETVLGLGVDAETAGDVLGAIRHARSSRRKGPPSSAKKLRSSKRKSPTKQAKGTSRILENRTHLVWLIAGIAFTVLLIMLVILMLFVQP